MSRSSEQLSPQLFTSSGEPTEGFYPPTSHIQPAPDPRPRRSVDSPQSYTGTSRKSWSKWPKKPSASPSGGRQGRPPFPASSFRSSLFNLLSSAERRTFKALNPPEPEPGLLSQQLGQLWSAPAETRTWTPLSQSPETLPPPALIS